MTKYKIDRSDYYRAKANRATVKVQSKYKDLKLRLCSHQVGLVGSYNTSNIGDLALGEAVKMVANEIGVNINLMSNYDKISKKYCPPNIIVGGGGIFNTHPNSPLKKILATKKKIVALLGLSGNLFEKELKENEKEKLSQIRFISLRSKRNVQTAKKIIGANVKYFPDLAFSLTKDIKLNKSTKSSSNTLGINVCPQLMFSENGFFKPNKQPSKWFKGHLPEESKYYSEIGPAYINLVREAVKGYINKNWNIKVIPFASEDDLFGRTIFKDLNVKFTNYTTSPLRLLREVYNCDAMLCTRYHSHVFSLATGTPFLSINYASKVGDLIDDLKLPRYATINRINIVQNYQESLKIFSSGNFVSISKSKRKKTILKSYEGIKKGLSYL